MPNTFFEDDKNRAKQRRYMTKTDLYVVLPALLFGLIGAGFGFYVAFAYADQGGKSAPGYVGIIAVIATLALLAAAYFTYRRDRLFTMIGLAFGLITPSGYAAYFSILAAVGAFYLLIRFVFYADTTLSRRR